MGPVDCHVGISQDMNGVTCYEHEFGLRSDIHTWMPTMLVSLLPSKL